MGVGVNDKIRSQTWSKKLHLKGGQGGYRDGQTGGQSM